MLGDGAIPEKTCCQSPFVWNLNSIIRFADHVSLNRHSTTHLVLLRCVALGADEYAYDACVAVPRRRVQRRVPVVVLDVRTAAAQQEHLQRTHKLNS